MKIDDLIAQSTKLPWNAVVFVDNAASLENSNFLVEAQTNVYNKVDGLGLTFDGNDGIWSALCTISDVQDVIENIKQQSRAVTSEMSRKALIYYLETDAFLNLGDKFS